MKRFLLFFLAFGSICLSLFVSTLHAQVFSEDVSHESVTSTESFVSSTVDIVESKEVAGVPVFPLIGQPLTALRIYRLDDPAFSLVTGVGEDPVSMPDYFFPSGEYVVVNTRDKDACAELSLEECRTSVDFIDEAHFSL